MQTCIKIVKRYVIAACICSIIVIEIGNIVNCRHLNLFEHCNPSFSAYHTYLHWKESLCEENYHWITMLVTHSQVAF